MRKIYAFILTFILLVAASPFAAFALPASFYAENSVLSEGRWTRIAVASTGMYLIPDASLRAMGFSDPAKVNVYGFGGRMLPEYLDESVPDDLPILPSIRTSKGILFFATDNVAWGAGTGTLPYAHTMNPYCSESYYFLSDRTAERPVPSRISATNSQAEPVRSFMDHLLHEEDLQGPDETGRVILGEDFRTQKSRSFSFKTPGATGEDGIVRIQFGANASAETSLTVSANGTRLPATSEDKIKAISGSNFINYISTSKTFEAASPTTSIDITYNAAGSVAKALLDYIELFYPRTLALTEGKLNFYFNEASPILAEISGCSSSTRIWDVTDPANPMEMEFRLSGDKAQIEVAAGYRHFVAFDPEAVAADAVTWTEVKNQNIHGLPTPDMVIITYDTYMEGAEMIADLHRKNDGMEVLVLRPEDIYNEFGSGSSDVTAFRRMLKMFYDRPGERSIRYCLLMGRPFYDNKGTTSAYKSLSYRPMPIWQSPSGTSESGSYSSDTYIAMLDDVASGKFNMSSAMQRVAVGRLPVKTAEEALTVARKIIKYANEPAYGAWRNKIMLIADDADDSMINAKPSANSSFFDQSQRVYSFMRSTSTGTNYIYDRVLLDAFNQDFSGIGLSYPAAKARMMSNWQEGVVWTNYMGHASQTSWTGEKLLTWTDINSFTNTKLTFLFGATCSFAYWDGKEVSGGEIMVLNPTAGVIGMIMPSRTVYIMNNSRLNDEIAKAMFGYNEAGERNRVGDIYRTGLNNLANDYNKLRYCLISDPALALPVPEHTVEISSIDGMDVTGIPADVPEIPALAKVEVKGRVLDKYGEIDPTFNGIVELLVYDAEKVVDTSKTGRGLQRTYNDRSIRLTSSTVKVSSGEWTARLLLPSEISNNYSPALISAYAWNETSGYEAHGHSEHLYIYGYSQDADPDTSAPGIESFYLNSKTFADGGVVNANPLVFASLYDESGINLSDFGIGHQLSLSLDDKVFYSDVNSYFTADIEREGAGSICYPLEDIEPGRHTLTLTVWDNAGNSASRSIDFNVGAAMEPVITDLNTNVNPASTDVTFSVTIDRPNSPVDLTLEVFDLSGRRVWSHESNVTTDTGSCIRVPWDLRDRSGVRVPRGIYLYRATITAPEGTYTSKTRKLAVTAQ